MRIAINHLTRMSAPRICIAGIDEATGRHVRPVTRATDPLTRELLEERGGPIAVGAVVDLGPVQAVPSRPESEDHRFQTTRATRVRHLDEAEYVQRLVATSAPDLQAIFGPELERRGRSYAVAEGHGNVSLGVLRDQRRPDLEVDGYGKLRLVLADAAGAARLGVTDLRFVEADHRTLRRDAIEDFRRRMRRGVPVLLMLGLARAFRAEGDDEQRHWLQVNGICLEDKPLS
jgi:hypothetical protein